MTAMFFLLDPADKRLFSAKAPYVVAILVSILLSFNCYLRADVINPDAVCYILSAQMFGEGGLQQAMHLCGQASWPFYSVLIHIVAQLTHLSHIVAAYLLNGFFSLISVLFFMLIVQRLGGSRRTVWFAALVILSAHQFNSVREYIVRDHGFWAFYLISIFCLLDYMTQPHWFKAWLWSLSLMLASLFRVEGFIFLFLMPFFAWFNFRFRFFQRLRQFLSLNSFWFVVLIGLILFLRTHMSLVVDHLDLGRLNELGRQVSDGLDIVFSQFQRIQLALSTHVLTADSKNDATLVLFLMVFSWFLASVVSNLSLIYAILIVYAWVRKAANIIAPMRLVIYGYLLINVIVTFAFLTERLFLSKRYLIALSLVLMLYVPFALSDLSMRWAQKRYRWMLVIASIFIATSGVGGIFEFGYSKAYLRHAGDWVRQHVPQQAKLYVNDYQLMFYTEHFGYELFKSYRGFENMQTALSDNKWRAYDYLAIRVNKHMSDEQRGVLKNISYPPVQVFQNKRGDGVVIYQVKGE